MACRRRETSGTNVSILCYIFFSSSSPSSFWDLCLSRSHIENQTMLPPVSRDDAAGQIWGLYSSGKQIKPDPVSRDDVAAKIWGLYRSGKQTTPDPALRPSSRHKSTKNRRPLPPPSTLTPTPPSPARRSLPSTRNPASTLHFSLPSELPSITSEQATPSLPIWNTCPPPCRKRRSLENGKTLIERMVSPLVMGPLSDGPLFFQLRPINRIFSPTTPPIWPRYFLTFLSSPILLTLQYFVSMDRRLSSCLILTLKVWSRGYQSQTMVVRSYWPLSMESFSLQTLDPLLPPTRGRCDCGNRLEEETLQAASSAEEDWKKAQVDSKKILAQPHQSATANPSPKRICIFEASLARKPPITMIGTIGDILSIAKSFYDLSFRFIENMFVDDFARTAVRSMTIGHNISLYLCFF